MIPSVRSRISKSKDILNFRQKIKLRNTIAYSTKVKTKKYYCIFNKSNYFHTPYYMVWSWIMKKVDKKQWFIVGLDVLAKDGFARITIDNLCGLLQITKGAFYHHFKNIDGYIDALMKYWLEVNTFEFIRETEKLHDIKEQQQKLADMAAYASIRNESVIRAWSYSSSIVRGYVSQADTIRLEYAAKLNEAMGLKAKQAMDMAIIHYSMLIGMQQICSNLSPEQFKELQDMILNKFKE